MKRLVEMTHGEIASRVGSLGACGVDTAPKNVFVQGADLAPELELTKAQRMEAAAPYCGSCVVRPACLELARRTPKANVSGSIYGGYYFETRKAVDVTTGIAVQRARVLGR